MKRITFLLTAAVALAAAFATAPGQTQSQGAGRQPPQQPRAAARVVKPPKKFNRVTKPVPGSYLVVLKEEALGRGVAAVAGELAAAHGGTVGFVYQSAIKGFSITMPEAAAEALSRHPLVDYVEEDAEGSLTQSTAPWHLDRIDQRDGLNGVYAPGGGDGQNVDIYIVDSGIRISHDEFDVGRATASAAADFVGDGQNGLDCHGHGTHVASLAGGKTYGVARSARLHSVRIADCSGAVTVGRAMAAIDWVTANKPPNSSPVINLSSRYSANFTLDQSVRNAIAADISVVVSAGNDNANAGSFSPQRVQEAITVGASTMGDARRFDSNFGSVVDIFAPGEDIRGAAIGSDTVTVIRSGTSQAAPLVAGAIARWRSTHPDNFGSVVWLVDSEVKRNTSFRRLAGIPSGTANRLLYTNYNYRARTTAHTTGEIYLFRYWQPQVGDHFYTIDFAELGLGSGGYFFEWTEGMVYGPNETGISGLTGLFRYYHGGITDHFYTTNFGTLGFGGSGWVLERNPECNVFAAQPPSLPTAQLLRYYNSAIGDHFYTTNFDELGNGDFGWVPEGSEGWVLTQTTGAP